METKLKRCVLIVFALAAALRLEAQIDPRTIDLKIPFLRISDFRGPRQFSTPVGAPVSIPPSGIAVPLETGGGSYVFGGVQGFNLPPAVVDLFNGRSVNGNPLIYVGDATFVLTDPIVLNDVLVLTGGSSGAYPTGLAVDSRNKIMYGITDSDGANGSGTVFQMNLDGSNLKSFSFPAYSPYGMGANSVYVDAIGEFFVGGTAGPGNSGVLDMFSDISTLSHEISEWMNDPFICTEGPAFISPVGQVQQAGAKANRVKPKAGNSLIPLYGVTFFGGTNGNGPGTGGYGTVFTINNDGSGYQALHVFSSQRATNGYGPAGGLALSGNTLYGTTSGGGKFGSGTVFKLDTSGSNFMVLKSFSAYGTEIVNGFYNYTNSDGMGPEGSLLLSGDTLYGTTFEGGTNGGGGTVYSINTNGNNFTVLHSFSAPVYDTNVNSATYGAFTNIGGGGTRAGVTLVGHALFGTTPYGGTYGSGTLFAIILPSPPWLNLAPMGGNFTASWQSSYTNFMLQQNVTLNPLTWSNFNGAVSDDGTNKSASIIPAPGAAFFRLINTNSP